MKGYTWKRAEDGSWLYVWNGAEFGPFSDEERAEIDLTRPQGGAR